MGSTTQPTTFTDLYTDLMNRVRAETSKTATINQSKRYINIALHDLHIGFGEKFPWTERDAVLRTKNDYTTGTVSIDKGSMALIGSSTLWDTNNDFSEKNAIVGGKIKISGNEVYEVTAVASDTSITLATPYISDDESGASYTYFEDEYDLASDFLKPIDVLSFSDNAEIRLISRQDFRRAFPRNNNPGKPRVATLIRQEALSDAEIRTRVRFSPPSNDTYLFPYTYVTSNLAVSSSGTAAANLSADTDEPIIPLAYRQIIVLQALYNWYRDKKDDQRSVEVKAEWASLLTRVVGDQEIGSNRPRFQPRVSAGKRRAKRPWGSGISSRISTGTRFDELR